MKSAANCQKLLDILPVRVWIYLPFFWGGQINWLNVWSALCFDFQTYVCVLGSEILRDSLLNNLRIRWPLNPLTPQPLNTLNGS